MTMILKKSYAVRRRIDPDFTPLRDVLELLTPVHDKFSYDTYHRLDRIIKSVICDPTCHDNGPGDEDVVFCPHKALKGKYKYAIDTRITFAPR